MVIATLVCRRVFASIGAGSVSCGTEAGLSLLARPLLAGVTPYVVLELYRFGVGNDNDIENDDNGKGDGDHDKG